MKRNIEKMIYATLDEVLNDLNLDNPVEKNLDTELYSGSGVLDSLALVSFLVNLEQKINHENSINITIASDRAMSMKHSPFNTVKSLVIYLDKVISETKN